MKKLFKEDTWKHIEEQYPDVTKEEKLRLYDISIKSRLAGANVIKQKMKEVLQTEYEKGRFDMREEMMKDAVEAQVFQSHDIEKAYEGYVYLVSNQFKDLKLLPPNKVKITIIKTE